MNIVVLAGGISTEREVSINTGYMVCKALRNKGHKAILLDVFFGEESSHSNVFIKEHNLGKKYTDLNNKTKELTDKMRKRKEYFGPNVLKICSAADLVFMALHGENGENGRVQAAFDLFGIRYTGTGYMGSALAMDKGISKTLFTYYNIPTPEGFVLRKGQKKIPDFPCVVKVSQGGSSVGVYIVTDEKEYEKALEDAFFYEAEVVVEQYIKGREFSVGVLNGKVLPVIEIATGEGFYDYKHKYIPGMAEEICPAEISEECAKKMSEVSLVVGKILKLGDYYRADFMMDKEENIYCLEVNTLPGMTATSLLPQEAACVGMDFEELCETIVNTSLKKYE